MKHRFLRLMSVWSGVVAVGVGGSAVRAASGPSAVSDRGEVIAQAGPGARPMTPAPPKVNTADVEFMAGMIPHHAQAVIMAGWAKSHGARKDVSILCERIVVGQTDEIKLMQTWLDDRGQIVPDAKSTKMKMEMDGMTHEMLMPGMLTDAEMAALDKARGPEFDRLFLIGMIKHHQGAIGMVDKLFASYGAGQDETVFRFASDVYADQSTEIDRMEKMLAATGGGLE